MWQPTISPEHGVYIVLLVSFLTGAAAAQEWNIATSLALVCAFLGFQAEHPIVLQIKQRKSWKPRFVLWGSVYSALAFGIAVYLYRQTPLLLWIDLAAIAALIYDAISVFYRQQKSIVNELVTFAAICLSAPLAYIATTGHWESSLLGLWLLNTLFFGSTIFMVKLRKPKTDSLVPGIVYHSIAGLIIIGLWYEHWLAWVPAIGFTIGLAKYSLVLWQLDWYKTAPIRQVAVLETVAAFLFLSTTALALLPIHPL